MARVIAKNRRLAAANSKWKVHFDDLSDEHGNEIHDYMVIEGHHPRLDRVTGVAILPVTDAGFVLLRCYRHALVAELWEIPRGFIDAGETPVDAALRELEDETGLRCLPRDLVPLGFYAPEPSTMAARGALFAATRCEGVPRPARDEIGLDAIKVVDRDAMESCATEGGLEDAGTLVAYYRFVLGAPDEAGGERGLR